ncbi:putative ABC transporter [Magnetofaba australis IT-1]|uniref:Putative ABC transporter n=1 Tax=Magnetofaba australis IT-1 TaxID=1434232 RepID=A0A1Y2K110_9PROT|nr:putative ABC transporter [Magnetofaba australis IT-1]
MTLVGNLLALALPLMLLQIYDRILPNQGFSTLNLLIIGVIMAILVEAELKLIRAYVGGWVGARFEHLSSYSAMERMLFTNLPSFEKVGSGVHLERMEALGSLKDFYSGQGLQVLLDLPFVLIFLGFIYHLGDWLVLVVLTVFGIFIGAALWVGKRLKMAMNHRMTADERRLNFIIETLSGMHSIKSMAMEALMLRRYERLQEGCAVHARHVVLQSATAQGIGSFYAQFTMILVAAVGATLVIDHKLTMGGMAACSMLAGRAMGPIQQAVGVWARFQTIRLAREKVNAIFHMPVEFKSGLGEAPQIQGRITLRDVSYSFAEGREPLLHDLNIDIQPGDFVGIRGDNGSGKSSLLWLMMGALRPSGGEVLIDGEDLRQYDPRTLRDKIAYLPQKGELFQGTLLDNITMFRDELRNDAVALIERMGLDEILQHMPKGYEMDIDDGTKQALPMGIRQRIVIARALLENPQVILFDEANASLDGAGDEQLRRFMDGFRGKATVVLISSRPSWLKLADRLFDLDDGELIEQQRTPPPPPKPKPAPSADAQPPAPPRTLAEQLGDKLDEAIELSSPVVSGSSRQGEPEVDQLFVWDANPETDIADNLFSQAFENGLSSGGKSGGGANRPKASINKAPAQQQLDSAQSDSTPHSAPMQSDASGESAQPQQRVKPHGRRMSAEQRTRLKQEKRSHGQRRRNKSAAENRHTDQPQAPEQSQSTTRSDYADDTLLDSAFASGLSIEGEIDAIQEASTPPVEARNASRPQKRVKPRARRMNAEQRAQVQQTKRKRATRSWSDG